MKVVLPSNRGDHVSAPKSSKRHPYWLWQAKRLFPHPLLAGCVSLGCLLVGILFAGVALNVPGCWPMGVPSALFFAGSFASAAAAFTRSRMEPRAVWCDVQTNKPTFAIFVLLIGTLSWLLILAMHVFEAFFKNGPGSAKYFVTLGIAISSALFMQVHGRRVVREHFGVQGGLQLELSGRQVVYVIVFVFCCGIYGAWLMI